MSDGALRFLPWLRRGLAVAIPTAGAAPNQQPERPAIPVALNIRHDATVEPVPVVLRLYGPGDVLQLDPAQVIATDPKPFANDFEPNYLVTISFDAPELPWLFTPEATPAETDPAGRLRPWLCLVVLRRGMAQITIDPRRPVPTVCIADATRELPDLAESWAWAHAQIVGPGALGEALEGSSDRTLSRLISPRRLQPATAYVACVVPTFAAGRQAAMGEEVTATIEPAWISPAQGTVQLPVYYSWEFSTGPAGDFESLARRLKPRDLDAQVGLRPMDISNAGPGLPVIEPGGPGSVLGLEGALRSLQTVPSEWPDGPREDFQRALAAQLQAAPGDSDSVLTPPVYGGAHAGVAQFTAEGSSPVWLRELNLDPRYRAAAASGVRVIQEQQEHLVAAAWDQIGELDRANQRLRESQLARAASCSLREKRFVHLAPPTLLRVTGPAHARIPSPLNALSQRATSLLGSIRSSVFPETAASTLFRRALRPPGPLGRRLGGDEPVSQLLNRLGHGSVKVPIAEQISGSVEHDTVGAQKLSHIKVRLSATPEHPAWAKGWKLVSEFLERSTYLFLPTSGLEAPPAPTLLVSPATQAPERSDLPSTRPVAAVTAMRRIDDDLPEDVLEAEPSRQRRLGGINGRFRAAARALQTYLADPGAPTPHVPAPTLPVELIASQLVGAQGRLDPEMTIPSAVLHLIENAPRPMPAGDVLAPIAVAPSFPQPMSGALRSLSADLLLPAADRIPPDTVGVLVGNARFIEAFMVGLNHEMGREFLWRGLPADPRATYFRQFWDVRGRQPSAPGPATDIPPIATWSPTSGLGANATRVGGRDMLVLLIRGELVHRYPTMTLYAVRAEISERMGSDELYPEFRTLLDPDILVVGFGIGLLQASGVGADPGWFFVLQEQVTEPRFGLDEADQNFGGILTSWRNLSWSKVVEDEGAYNRLSHVPIDSPLLNHRLRNLPLEGATWGRSSADMAQIMLQLPVRVAVHARTFLSAASSAPTRISAVWRAGDKILAIGGVDDFGEPWRLIEYQAIAAIHAGGRYYVEQPPGNKVEVVVALRAGAEYLKTTADADVANTLLNLPELPV